MSNCILWTGAKRLNGYGEITRNKKSHTVHKYFYEQKYGKVPVGLVIDHLCRNRLCINIDHLEVVTCAENIRRGMLAKVNLKKVNEIKKLYREKKFFQKELAKMYSVSQSAISLIVNERTWA